MEITDRLQEALASEFEPDTLLPVQYHELMRRRQGLDGERRLLLAVLEDAVECYLKNMNAKGRRRRVLFYEVCNWMNTKNRVGLFTYETLCEALGIEANRLRAALEKRRRGLNGSDRQPVADIGRIRSRREARRRAGDTRTSDIAVAAG